MLSVLLNEPYFSGSHAYWAKNIHQYSSHKITLATLPGRNWKWRMKGSALELSRMFADISPEPSVILCSSMMDVALYRSLINRPDIPVAYYMHENQLCYPSSPDDPRRKEDFHYGFLNFTSCLASDLVLFNSEYHRREFLDALSNLLHRLPDYSDPTHWTKLIYDKSEIVYVGIDVNRIKPKAIDLAKSSPRPTLLWNHRWESDKRPDLFETLVLDLYREGHDFNLILLGKNGNRAQIKEDIVKKLSSKIIFSGYAQDYEHYCSLLAVADIMPVTSEQDYYGISVIEAILCNCHPIMPKGRVYSEFFPPKDLPRLFYSDYQELLGKTREAISSCITGTEALKAHLTAHDVLTSTFELDSHLKKLSSHSLD